MTVNRRETILLALASAGATLPGGALAMAKAAPSSTRARWGATVEGQRRADLGNGTYLNPVLAGDRPDPNVLKDGDDYYAAFSSFLYYPGVPIWHSRDLVNWTPITAALKAPIGNVWALDIAKHDGRYFIYIPVLDDKDPGRALKTYVIHAPSMKGPWSEPIDMRIDGLIDPGHAMGEDGKRYLFFNGGNRVQLSDDGLSAVGKVQHVYGGWPIPENWIIEGFALEGPKITRKDGWFYMFSGQGGTAGPPTSHMVVVARSRSIDGPWENCPHNPIVRTASREEPWWSRGHATAIEGPDGKWWLVYHGYENGLRTLGRQMLLEPIEWIADGWPRATGGDLSRPLPKPGGAGGAHGQPLSGFSPDAIGNKLTFWAPRPGYLDRARIAGHALTLTGQGTGPADASPLLFVAGDRSYEVRVELELDGATQAGLILFYNEKLFCGLGVGPEKLHAYRIGQEERWPAGAPIDTRRLHLRLVNDEDVVTFYYSRDGKRWTKERSFEVAGYNHNVADGFLSLRPGLYAAGEGKATFRNLTYRGLEGVSDSVRP
ncbi:MULTISPECIES: family 43 glycosylhydrolase [Sphingomonas]|uniref:family 43 glycosylhydrolase n=1 Tax=Sphingomonas TaxID=13687 RepID=UPI000F7E9B93|nr:family 43 glycosylhydrolase [Sphingomonas sp. ABOLF]RSV12185.1 xylan 1,4-beta-xylosidase [Sphingomonas sp. ABOLF]GLK22201.1 xylosidase [Microbacterium terregens]